MSNEVNGLEGRLNPGLGVVVENGVMSNAATTGEIGGNVGKYLWDKVINKYVLYQYGTT